MFAQQCADPADHAGTIRVFEHKNNSMRARFDRPRIDANDSWSDPEKCAANRYVLPFGTGGKLEHVGVITGRAQPRLGNFQTQTFGEGRGINFIHFGSAGAFVAGFLGRVIGWYEPGQPAGFIASIIGAMLLLLLYRLIRGRRP